MHIIIKTAWITKKNPSHFHLFEYGVQYISQAIACIHKLFFKERGEVIYELV